MSDADGADWPPVRDLGLSEDEYLNRRYPVEGYRWIDALLLRVDRDGAPVAD